MQVSLDQEAKEQASGRITSTVISSIGCLFIDHT
jgi:hypothetical protein